MIIQIKFYSCLIDPLYYNYKTYTSHRISLRISCKIMTRLNYLEEIPEDVVDIIINFVKINDYDIYAKTERNYFTWSVNNFIDDRLHKNISNFTYAIKAGENSKEFIERDNIAKYKLKIHIDKIVKNMRFSKIKKILRNNSIYNAKDVYEHNNPTCKKNIKCYERELFSQYVLSGYYMFTYVKKIEY